MRPVMPAARNSARVKKVLPAPRSPRRWIWPPGFCPDKAGSVPHSMGDSSCASRSVLCSFGKTRVSESGEEGVSDIYILWVPCNIDKLQVMSNHQPDG